jgi:membrane protein implicated in regulation of membrane protease activity
MPRRIEDYYPLVKEAGELRTAKPVVFESTLTLTGALTHTAPPVYSGGVTQTVNINALVGATIVLTAAMSGSLNINRSTSGTPSWTLPTAAAGLWYDFLVTSTTAGFTVTGGTIFARANPNGASVTGTTLTNTQGTAVVGDHVRLVCDGTSWRGTAQTGIFAAS